MANNAPGMHFREGISLIKLFQMFPDDKAAEAWFIHTRWPNGMACPHCGSTNVNEKATHPTMPFRCRDCVKYFSGKTGTIMARSKLGYQIWIYVLTCRNGYCIMRASKLVQSPYVGWPAKYNSQLHRRGVAP